MPAATPCRIPRRLLAPAAGRPDRPTHDGPFAGDDVYSATAAGETKTISVARGQAGTLYVSIQNDGLFADAFKIKGTGAARGFTVSYFKGTTNVTAKVEAGTFSTGSLRRARPSPSRW